MTRFEKILSGLALAALMLIGTGHAFGAFNPVGAGTYLLNGSISATQNTITLNSFTEPKSGIPYTMSYINANIIYGTLAPPSGNSEFVSATGITQNGNGTATLTGVIRGLSRTPGTGGCVASSTLASAFPGQTQFILSNSPCFYSQYAVKQNDETVSGDWTFTNHAPTIPTELSSAVNRAASIAYVNAIAISGAPNASETVKGIVQLATALQAASTTSSGSTAARLVIPASIATDTPQSGCATGYTAAGAGCSVEATLNGKIRQTWLDIFTTVNTWIGANIFSATTTIAASSVTNNALVLDTLPYKFPSARAASSTVLSEDGNGNLSFQTPHAVYSAFNIVGATATNAYATTSLITIPAGVMTASSTIEITGYAVCQRNANSGGQCLIYLRDATGAKFLSWAFSSKSTANGTDTQGMFTINILPNGSASAQETIGDSTVVGLDLTGAGSTAQLVGILGANDSTSAINLAAGFTLNGVVQAVDANETAKIQEIAVTIKQ